ncbi:MAG: hypothetical protein IVW54_21760 [Candidatus Binataceae bacterium]|nr:hypothetical protein [Candidatus Binataceae bacterium]
MNAYQMLVTRILAAIAGFAYITLSYNIPLLVNMELGHDTELAFVILAPIALILSFRSQKNPWSVAPFIFLGVLAGIATNVFLDKKADRNLFPIEMGIWCVMLAPAIVLGTAVGVWLRKIRT